jgi:hypothetical protein
MKSPHAAIWLGSRRARVIHFDEQQFSPRRFRKTTDLRPVRGRDEAAWARFFDEVCDEVEGVPELLLTGTEAVLAAFERHVATSLPQLGQRVVGVQCLVTPSGKRLSALARWHFTPPALPCAGQT